MIALPVKALTATLSVQIGLAYDHALEAEGLNDAQGAHDRKRDGEDAHLSRREKAATERPARQIAARESWLTRSPSTLSSPQRPRLALLF
jgi:hypothetical protein